MGVCEVGGGVYLFGEVSTCAKSMEVLQLYEVFQERTCVCKVCAMQSSVTCAQIRHVLKPIKLTHPAPTGRRFEDSGCSDRCRSSC